VAELSRLREVFRKSLELPPDLGVDDLTYRGAQLGADRWDSLAHMALVAGLEDAFDILIDTDDVIEISSFAKAREILGRYGVEFTG
jgi:acyl carrier protein